MIEFRQEQGIAVLTVTVHEIEMYVIPTFKAALMERLQDKPGTLVLDLDRVEFIDSSGIGALLLMAKKAKEAGGKLFIIGLRPEIREMMEVTGTIGLLAVKDTLADVLAV